MPKFHYDDLPHYYVVGKLRDNYGGNAHPILAVVSRASFGWRVRTTDASYNHDYVCHESFDNLMDWLNADLVDAFLCRNRGEVMEVLTVEKIPTGFLLPGDGASTSLEEAEGVLRHLENAWGASRTPSTPPIDA